MSLPDESSFGDSVQNAVRQAVADQKPLFVFLKDSTNTDLNQQLLNKYLSSLPAEKLKEKFILLKLTHGTPDFGYFEQLFSSLVVPSFCVVIQGKLQHILSNEGSTEDFEKLIGEMGVERLNQQEAVASASAAETSNNNTSESRRPPHESQPSSRPSTSTTNNANSSTSPQQVLSPHEKTVLRHKEIIAEQRRSQMQEKKRLRDLLEADRREMHSRMRAEQRQNDKSLPESGRNMGTGTGPNHARNVSSSLCTLAIKLFDGSTIRHEFESQQTLTDVRNYLDEEIKVIPSTGKLPAFATTFQPTGYQFHRPTLPRITYSEEQESSSLQKLDLTPRSILILKPTYNDPSAGDVAPDGEKLGVIRSIYRGVRRLGSALYSFFDYGVDDVHHYEGEHPANAPPDHVLDLPYPVAPGLLSVGDRALSSSLISIETDDRDSTAAPESRPTESRSSTPRSFSSNRIQTVHDSNEIRRIDTYNGNSINLNERDDE
ncbi:uncharacterized protein LODBEIA_P28080 [Lodderomyces beijingensis]|uniref:UBX domain-containing protein n=1 Tax=Lodderomyces beijingensis TaxID=1775926 RepID=A0ABP0ZL16_9ASCO